MKGRCRTTVVFLQLHLKKWGKKLKIERIYNKESNLNAEEIIYQGVLNNLFINYLNELYNNNLTTSEFKEVV